MQQVFAAREKLATFGLNVSIWSVTSYNELSREAEACERHNRLHPDAAQQIPYVQRLFAEQEGVFVAASDYMKSLPNSIARWMPEDYLVLGTDGYGLSESRADLRRYFEVSCDYICHAALVGLYRRGTINKSRFAELCATLDIAPDKSDPMEH